MNLEQALRTGFIDHQFISLQKYRPQLLLNNHKQGEKVLTSLIQELKTCEAFYFSVAFITTSGVAVLIETLKELEGKGIKGKIIASIS